MREGEEKRERKWIKRERNKGGREGGGGRERGGWNYISVPP